MNCCILLMAVSLTAGESPESPIKSDEQVLFFPTYGRFDDKSQEWVVRIHGWIFERSLRGRLAYPLLKQSLDLRPADDEEQARLDQRAAALLVDNERGKAIAIRIGGRTFALNESAANGHFRGEIRLGRDAAARSLLDDDVPGDWLEFQAITADDDSRVFAGRARLIDAEGRSIISDIDDTIKISEVGDRRALMANTFLKPFRPVDGLAEVYRRWQADGAAFHYVTASPWQLQQPLSEFLNEHRFPAGEFRMKNFRWADASFFELFRDHTDHKTRAIETILADFPRRKFILVGDAGEQDPEIYGELARRHTGQIERVLIRARDKREAGDEARWAKAFRDVPEERWQVFTAAGELGDR